MQTREMKNSPTVTLFVENISTTTTKKKDVSVMWVHRIKHRVLYLEPKTFNLRVDVTLITAYAREDVFENHHC